MILELAWLYVPVAAIAVIWAFEIRPLRHLLHSAPLRAHRRHRRAVR